MTQEKYLELMEQLGKTPNAEEMPPSIDDFPEVVVDAVTTFNLLGDRVYPDVGYTGKDYSNLDVFLKLYQVEDTEFFVYILNWLDSRAIKRSQEQLKKEHEKLKRKSRGK
jgi:hypothetical protein